MTQIVRTARSFVHWLRLVWPPAWAGLTVLLMWAICEFSCWEMWCLYGDAVDPRLFHFPRDAGLLLAVGLYGAHRAIRFHSVFCSDYHDWLKLSPWNSRKSLPLGPVHLTLQDALLLGLLALLWLYAPALPLAALPLAFLTAYLAGLLLAHLYTGPNWVAYVLAFGLAAAVRCLWWSPQAALCVVALLTVFSQVALSVSLAQFPWDVRLWKIRAATAFAYDRQEGTRRTSREWPREVECADILRLWPRNVLYSHNSERLVGRVDFVLISLLAGTVAYCVTAGVPLNDDSRKFLSIFVAGLALGVPIARVSSYSALHHPPISLFGRLVTGRWIIPGYDVVLLTPLASCLTALTIYFVLITFQISFGVSLGLVVDATLLVAFLGGPAKRRWQLTSPCQLVSSRVGGRTAEQI